MAIMRCPHCAVPLTHDEAHTGSCPACGESFSARQAAPARASRSYDLDDDVRAPRRGGDRHTNKCDALLPPQYRGRFTVLAMVMEKASILWALLLSPLLWAFLNKHYVLAYDAAGRRLLLFRLSLGLLGPGQAYEVREFPLVSLHEKRFRSGLLTARLSFRGEDGRKINLFIPMPSKANARAVFESLPPL
jgi:hypothetical protein